MDEIKKQEKQADDVEWDNDKLFFTHTESIESSRFDPKAKWCPGSESYERLIKVRVPKALEHSEEMIDAFVWGVIEHYPDTDGFHCK